MDQSIFKFAFNVSRRVFTNFSFISRHATKLPLNIDYYLIRKKEKHCLHSQNYFHTNTIYYCKAPEIINDKAVEKLNSEFESSLDTRDSVFDVPVLYKKNVLEPARDSEVNLIAPIVRPTFNLAAYADKNVVLKHFIQLGVEIGEWDKNKEICANILGKDFENDIKPYICFLNEHGVPLDNMGNFIKKNPHIFEQSLENIQIRINYLESRKFKKENITYIINKAPKWLNYNVIDIDRQLGVFKKKFKLLNKEVIELATRDPKLILYIVDTPFLIERSTRTLDGSLGFTMSEQKKLLLGNPRIYRTKLEDLIKRFDVIHGEMKLSHEMISMHPKILGLRDRKLKERHSFLKFLGRAQYDPTKPGYVSPKNFVSGNDAEFANNLAGSGVEIMNDFLKTL